MSYGMAGALQAGLYQHLSADPALTALIGGALYDDVPPGDVPETYVTLGVEQVRDRSDKLSALAEHRVTVTAVTQGNGFAAAKAAAAAVSDALIDAAPLLDRGRIVLLGFQSARARKVRANRMREIELIFRVIVDED